MPSLFIEVSNISPAPNDTASVAHWVVLISVFVLPPFRYTYHSPSSSFFVSMANTTHWLPNSLLNCCKRAGFLNAAVFTETLSAPFCNNIATSSTELIPPPTVKGIFMLAAIRFTSSTKVFLFSIVAVISKKTSSSAPFSEYKIASSTGSPASRIDSKLMPFTVLPSFISKQGIILLVKPRPPLPEMGFCNDSLLISLMIIPLID